MTVPRDLRFVTRDQRFHDQVGSYDIAKCQVKYPHLLGGDIGRFLADDLGEQEPEYRHGYTMRRERLVWLQGYFTHMLTAKDRAV